MSIGSEFMPPLDEGSLLYMPVTLPNVSLNEAKRLIQVQDTVIKSLDIDIDREAAARYGVSVGDVQEVISTALGGEMLSTSVEVATASRSGFATCARCAATSPPSSASWCPAWRAPRRRCRW